jgi:glutathione peroxidase
MHSTALALATLLLIAAPMARTACPPLLQHSVQKLHSEERIDLCERFGGRPMLIVNTASHCGFTPQFKALEAMHRQYSDRGIGFLGVPSNSFRQEADTEGETAEVCYVNYGVSFLMTAPVAVRGADAHPLFADLTSQSEAPRWNFYKYVVDAEGSVVATFPSTTAPDDPAITELLESLAD